MKRPRLCFVTAVPMTITAFLNPHIEHLAASHDIHVVADLSGGDLGISARARRLHVPIARAIAPWRDLLALVRLWRLFRRYRFDIVHSVTPKAGLLAMLAGFLARVPRRIHCFTGQVWAARRGPGRRLLKSADRWLARLATHLLADSPSQRDFLIREGVCPPGKIQVIGDGSIAGVDLDRFRPDAAMRAQMRSRLGIPDGAGVVLYLGRLNVDKGMRELATALNRVCAACPSAHFLLVGPDEGGLQGHFRERCAAWLPRLHFAGYTDTPEQYMTAADIFCLPSYREGFGSTVIEAAATQLPAVASRIYGLTDAVDDGVSGILVPPRDAEALARALLDLLHDAERRHRMGQAARAQAVERFAQQRIVVGLGDYYASLERE